MKKANQMRYKIAVIDKVFGLATSITALFFLLEDVYEYVVIIFFSEGILYVGTIPLAVRASQWIYLILFIFAGYCFYKAKKGFWYLYQLAAIGLIIEKLLIYFIFQSFFYGFFSYHFLLPVISGLSVLLYTNQNRVLQISKLERGDTYLWFMIAVAFGLLNFLVPKLFLFISNIFFYLTH